MGLRAEPGAALDPESSADELARRLAEHGLAGGPLVLIGHSASCQVVAELARRHPHTVAGLVLVGPTADPRMSPRRRLVVRWLRTAAREDPRRVPGMLRSYATTRLSGFARALRAARRRDLRATLAATTVPVLLVGGPHDHLAPSGWLDALAATRPGIEVVTMTAGGAQPAPDPPRRARPAHRDAHPARVPGGADGVDAVHGRTVTTHPRHDDRGRAVPRRGPGRAGAARRDDGDQRAAGRRPVRVPADASATRSATPATGGRSARLRPPRAPARRTTTPRTTRPP